MSLKKFNDFSVSEAIDIDFGKARQQGKESAEKTIKTIDSFFISTLGKELNSQIENMSFGDLGKKISEIIKRNENKYAIPVIIAALLTNANISERDIQLSCNHLPQDKVEIVQDSLELNLDSTKLTFTKFDDLTKPSGEIGANHVRPKDGWGSGEFAAPRASKGKSYDHRGLDIWISPGQEIFSPIDGVVKRIDVKPYSDDDRFTGVDIIGVGKDAGLCVRIFYINPLSSMKVGDNIRRKDLIGHGQDLGIKYNKNRNKDKGNINNHIHFEVRQPSKTPRELINCSEKEYKEVFGQSKVLDPNSFLNMVRSTKDQGKKDINDLSKSPKSTSDQGKKDTNDYYQKLANRESGGDPEVINRDGFMGKYQMGEDALSDVARKEPSLSHLAEIKSDDFRKNPSIFSEADQDKAIKVYTQANREYLRSGFRNIKPPGVGGKSYDVDPYDYYTDFEGEEIPNVPLHGGKKGTLKVTKAGVLGGAHLGGAGSVKVFLNTGGKVNPKDKNGVHISEYMDLLGGTEVPKSVTGEEIE